MIFRNFLRAIKSAPSSRHYHYCDTAAKIFYVTLKEEPVIKGSGNFMEENSSLYITPCQN